jgi:hypothetical protein
VGSFRSAVGAAAAAVLRTQRAIVRLGHVDVRTEEARPHAGPQAEGRPKPAPTRSDEHVSGRPADHLGWCAAGPPCSARTGCTSRSLRSTEPTTAQKSIVSFHFGRPVSNRPTPRRLGRDRRSRWERVLRLAACVDREARAMNRRPSVRSKLLTRRSPTRRLRALKTASSLADALLRGTFGPRGPAAPVVVEGFVGELAVLGSRLPPQVVDNDYLSSCEPPPRPGRLTGQRPWTQVHACQVENAGDVGSRRLLEAAGPNSSLRARNMK